MLVTQRPLDFTPPESRRLAISWIQDVALGSCSLYAATLELMSGTTGEAERQLL